MIILALHSPGATANTTYLWTWVVIGIITIFGFGITVTRWLRNQGAADARLEARLIAIETKLSPNGLNTDDLGDMAKRTENAVNDLNRSLERHIGASDQIHKELWRAINRRER